MSASITRPHGTGRVLDAESCWEGVESWKRVRKAENNDGEAFLIYAEADGAWDYSLVPAAITRPCGRREGFGSRVKLGGRVERGKVKDSVEEQWERYSKR